METNTTNINLEKDKIVEVVIRDPDWDENESYPDGVLATHYLVNPDREKLEQLKLMIERRFDYSFREDVSAEEIAEAEKFLDNVWDNIAKFIEENFVSLNISDTFTISY